MISIRGLHRRWGTFALQAIDLEVAAGEYFVLLGPSGAGKTLLLETVAGFHRAEQGTIRIRDADCTHLPPQQRGLGFVYQSYALFPHLSVRGNLEYGPNAQARPLAEWSGRFQRVVDMLELGPLLERMPEELSGGERQRVALGRALCLEVQVLLLDEPLSALDPALRSRLWRDLKRVHGALAPTVLHVTHDFEEALALADRMCVMADGKIVQTGRPDEVFRKPVNEFVAHFAHSENVFRGQVTGRQGEDEQEEVSAIVVGGLTLAAITRHSGDVGVTVRPEDILLSAQAFASSARNAFPGRVVSWSPGLAITRVRVAVAPEVEFVAAVTNSSFRDLHVEQGSPVHLIFKATAVHTF